MFEPSEGYTTDYYRTAYIKDKKIIENKSVTSIHSLDNDTDKLYFWQLYSVLGEDRIYNIIETFYTNIFNDNKNTYFVKTFENLGNIKYHILGQYSFWLDVMGGGKKYAGGEFRLHRHHNFAKHILNKNGAKVWINHMIDALNNKKIDLTSDKRVKPCIYTFLIFFMKKYATEYNFLAKL